MCFKDHPISRLPMSGPKSRVVLKLRLKLPNKCIQLPAEVFWRASRTTTARMTCLSPLCPPGLSAQAATYLPSPSHIKTVSPPILTHDAICWIIDGRQLSRNRKTIRRSLRDRFVNRTTLPAASEPPPI